MWTVGHSTRPAEEFAAVLASHGIQLVADVRRFPGSRRHPHFARDQLAPFLRARGIDYRWMPELGGRRRPRHDSPNTGWRVEGFRGYADYMETPEFADAFAALLDAAYAMPTAIMCAEALWWQCHRRLISDALVVAGATVLHIRAPKDTEPHRLLPPGHLVHGRLSYANVQKDLDLDLP